MPSRSHASSNSGVGGLCDVRYAFDAHLLQLLDAEVLQAIRQRRADAGVILVIARALDLHRLAVEEEALVGVEVNRADAERRLVAIDRARRRSDERRDAAR